MLGRGGETVSTFDIGITSEGLFLGSCGPMILCGSLISAIDWQRVHSVGSLCGYAIAVSPWVFLGLQTRNTIWTHRITTKSSHKYYIEWKNECSKLIRKTPQSAPRF